MKLIYAIGVYRALYGIENEVCSVNSSFTEILKRILLNYGLWGKITAVHFNDITLF